MKTKLNIFIVLIIALMIGVTSCSPKEEPITNMIKVFKNSESSMKEKTKALNDYINKLNPNEGPKLLEDNFHVRSYIDKNGHTITTIVSSGLSTVNGVYHDPECEKCKLNKLK